MIYLIQLTIDIDINYCTIKFISAHCQPHRGFHKNNDNHSFVSSDFLAFIFQIQ